MRLKHTFPLALSGLRPGTAQVWGSIRIVPVLRDNPITRLHMRAVSYGPMGAAQVSRNIHYTAWMPYGLILTDNPSKKPATQITTQLGEETGADRLVPIHHRMVKKTGRDQIRMLPLHTALEGFLAMHFGGPEVAHRYWSHRALRTGLSPRTEYAAPGGALPGLAEALRVFEIHPRQSGALVFVADALASAFVVPRPADYRALHQTLLQDVYGALIHNHGWLQPDVQPDTVALLDTDAVQTTDDIARLLADARQAWSAWSAGLASGVLGRSVQAERIRRVGPFALYRFLTGLQGPEEHIGECIRTEEGDVAYLKTFRLAEDALHRARLLDALASHGWDLHQTAATHQQSPLQLVRVLIRAGLGGLLARDAAQHVRTD